MSTTQPTFERGDRLTAAFEAVVSTASVLVDRNCTYDGPNIVIPCASHSEAIALLSKLRSAIDRVIRTANE